MENRRWMLEQSAQNQNEGYGVHDFISEGDSRPTCTCSTSTACARPRTRRGAASGRFALQRYGLDRHRGRLPVHRAWRPGQLPHARSRVPADALVRRPAARFSASRPPGASRTATGTPTTRRSSACGGATSPRRPARPSAGCARGRPGPRPRELALVAVPRGRHLPWPIALEDAETRVASFSGAGRRHARRDDPRDPRRRRTQVRPRSPATSAWWSPSAWPARTASAVERPVTDRLATQHAAGPDGDPPRRRSCCANRLLHITPSRI